VNAPLDNNLRPTFRLEFRPAPDSKVNTIVGLRRLMKRSLRAYGLVCTKVEELPDGVDSELAMLRKMIERLADRIASQAEQLTRLAERAEVWR
jgi:hypothetical protein